MTEYVTKKEFDETISGLKKTLETSLMMATVASTALGVVFATDKNSDKTLEILKTAFAAGEANFLYSPMSDDSIKKYRECCQVLLDNLQR